MTTKSEPVQHDPDRMRAHEEHIRRFYNREPTDRDRRFFALRDSGYQGPIDQDGYAVTPLLNLL